MFAGTGHSDSMALLRSPYLWKDADSFRPQRFLEENSNAEFGGWPHAFGATQLSGSSPVYLPLSRLNFWLQQCS